MWRREEHTEEVFQPKSFADSLENNLCLEQVVPILNTHNMLLLFLLFIVSQMFLLLTVPIWCLYICLGVISKIKWIKI